jgi:triosephosphate isomerase (TIM)
MRRPFIIGAQKLFLNLSDSIQFSKILAASLENRSLPFDVLICPSLISLAHVAAVLDKSPVYAGAQNFHQEGAGAFTGQVSLHELININVRHVLIGHLELRQQGETDDMIRHKIELCLKHGITPIVCLGESRDERGPGQTFRNLERRINGLFSDAVVNRSSVDNVIVAYEPAWIELAGDRDELRRGIRIANDTGAAIRGILNELFGPRVGENVRVLFGGGVNESSAGMLLQELQMDGFLIGRAGVKISSFLRILEAAEESIRVRGWPGVMMEKAGERSESLSL